LKIKVNDKNKNKIEVINKIIDLLQKESRQFKADEIIERIESINNINSFRFYVKQMKKLNIKILSNRNGYWIEEGQKEIKTIDTKKIDKEKILKFIVMNQPVTINKISKDLNLQKGKVIGLINELKRENKIKGKTRIGFTLEGE
jgi:hypothetical protein